ASRPSRTPGGPRRRSRPSRPPRRRRPARPPSGRRRSPRSWARCRRSACVLRGSGTGPASLAPGRDAGSRRASGYDGPAMDLVSERADGLADQDAPLAARMRPRTLEEFVGQGHVLGSQSALRALIEADELRSVILWGPAGTGKTSLAHIIAQATRSHFEELSATSAGVKDVRAVLAAARERLGALGRRSILFIDEIHRFNKGQQDALL